jgi:hypothetical protein
MSLSLRPVSGSFLQSLKELIQTFFVKILILSIADLTLAFRQAVEQPLLPSQQFHSRLNCLSTITKSANRDLLLNK